MMGLDVTIQAITNKESGVKEYLRASRTLRKCFRGNVEGRSPDSKERNKMKAHELIKLLDNTFHDVEFDVFEDTEGLVRVNFVVNIEEDQDA